jgi:hypothetical protein
MLYRLQKTFVENQNIDLNQGVIAFKAILKNIAHRV